MKELVNVVMDPGNCQRGMIREWSLITGRGCYKTGGGGQVKFYRYKKGAVTAMLLRQVTAMLKGGHKKCWGSFNTGA